MSTAQKALLVIFISMNFFMFAIDPVLGGIFFLLWPMWFKKHYREFEI